MKRMHRNKKGVELSINMLVIIALAVFALFLIFGFVSGGFGFFRDIFGGLSGRSPDEVAQIKCQTDIANWKNAGSPDIRINDSWDGKLCQYRADIDFNNDGTKDAIDKYLCDQYINAPPTCPSLHS